MTSIPVPKAARQTRIVFWDTFGTVTAAIGVGLGLVGLLQRENSLILFMILTVFLYAVVRAWLGHLLVQSLEVRTSLVVRIIRWDTAANVLAALGVGAGLIGLLGRYHLLIAAMVISIFLYALFIGIRGRLAATLVSQREQNLQRDLSNSGAARP